MAWPAHREPRNGYKGLGYDRPRQTVIGRTAPTPCGGRCPRDRHGARLGPRLARLPVVWLWIASQMTDSTAEPRPLSTRPRRRGDRRGDRQVPRHGQPCDVRITGRARGTREHASGTARCAASASRSTTVASSEQVHGDQRQLRARALRHLVLSSSSAHLFPARGPIAWRWWNWPSGDPNVDLRRGPDGKPIVVLRISGYDPHIVRRRAADPLSPV